MNHIETQQKSFKFLLSGKLKKYTKYIHTISLISICIYFFSNLSLDKYFPDFFEYFDAILISISLIYFYILIQFEKKILIFKETLSTLDNKIYNVPQINFESLDKRYIFWSFGLILLFSILQTPGQDIGDIFFYFLTFNLIKELDIHINKLSMDYEIIGKKDLITMKKISNFKENEALVDTIKKHLQEYSFSEVFKDRVNKAVLLIENISKTNKDIYIHSEEREIHTQIELNNRELNLKLKEILKDIIDYNNEKNDIIVANIDRNIKILQSIKDK